MEVAILVSLALAVFGLVITSLAADPNKDSGYIAKGQVVYSQFCVSCHSANGKGSGINSAGQKSAPPDLTSISQKYKGFPTAKIMNWIDGQRVESSGREMPIWGQRFRTAGGSDVQAFGNIYALTKYLESIQNVSQAAQK